MTCSASAGGCDGTGGNETDPWSWQTAAGPVVFAPFTIASDYFPADKAYMLNLRAAGVAFETRAEWDSPEAGRFARIHDPEGDPIELWEQPAA